MDNYLQEIENEYTRIRGKFSLLSPKDWALAQSWEEKGIPLRIVLKAMSECFRQFHAQKRTGLINSLSYFTQEVEKQFADWSKTRVGKQEKNTMNIPEPDAAAMNSILGIIEDIKQAIPNLPEELKPIDRDWETGERIY